MRSAVHAGLAGPAVQSVPAVAESWPAVPAVVQGQLAQRVAVSAVGAGVASVVARWASARAHGSLEPD